jgi:hypothetical protein
MPGKRKVNYSARSAFWHCGDCRKKFAIKKKPNENHSLSILSIDAWFQSSFFVSVPFPDRFNIAIKTKPSDI